MIDGEIPDYGFERRHLGAHNAFLLRQSNRAADMARASAARRDALDAAMLEHALIARGLVIAIARLAGRNGATRSLPAAKIFPFRRDSHTHAPEAPAAYPLAAGASDPEGRL